MHLAGLHSSLFLPSHDIQLSPTETNEPTKTNLGWDGHGIYCVQSSLPSNVATVTIKIDVSFNGHHFSI